MVIEMNRVFVGRVLRWSFWAHRRKSDSDSIGKLLSGNLHPVEAISEEAAVMRWKRDGVGTAIFTSRAEVLIGRYTSRGDVRKNKFGLEWWKPMGQRRQKWDMMQKENWNLRDFTGESWNKSHITWLDKERGQSEQSSLLSKAESLKALKNCYSHRLCLSVVFLDQFNKLRKEDSYFLPDNGRWRW